MLPRNYCAYFLTQTFHELLGISSLLTRKVALLGYCWLVFFVPAKWKKKGSFDFCDDKSLPLVVRDARDNGRKALTILRGHYLSKGKPKIISLYIELTSLRKLELESITDYIIRTENISNAPKQAGEVISDDLPIVTVLKGLAPNFK